jgi:hypothetical protein
LCQIFFYNFVSLKEWREVCKKMEQENRIQIWKGIILEGSFYFTKFLKNYIRVVFLGIYMNFSNLFYYYIYSSFDEWYYNILKITNILILNIYLVFSIKILSKNMKKNIYIFPSIPSFQSLRLPPNSQTKSKYYFSSNDF